MECSPRFGTVLGGLPMDSAVLGLAALGCVCCMVLGFEQNIALEDAVGSQACWLQALAYV
jgi:hypothetical protein